MCAVANFPEPTDARFSLRFLLIATAIVSLLAAIVGAVAQRSSPEVRMRLTIYWAIWLASTMVWTIVQLQRRKRAEGQAGATILRLPMNGDPSVPASLTGPAIGSAILVLISLLFANVMIAFPIGVTATSDWVFRLGFPLFLSLLSTSQFVPRLLWMREARFCEVGILWDQRVLPWDHLIDYKWIGSRELRLELFSVDAPKTTIPWLSVPVANEDCAAVRSVLENRAQPISVPGSAHRVGVGQVPITDVLQKAHLRRHLFAVMAGIIGGGALIFLGIWRETGAAEFDQTKSIGFYLWLFLISVTSQWRGRQAGGALVRIFARRDWFGFFVTMILAVIVYIAAIHMIWPSAWFAYAAGLMFWYLIMKTFTYFFMTQLDLRANGIVLLGAFHYPWSKLRLISWDPAQSGRLVFARGLRRIVAIVLPEQRDAVSAVLKEKLGYAAA